MSASEQCRAMYLCAKRDHKSLRHMLDPEEHDDEVFGFHAQQAVEKGLKCWIAFLDIQYPLTHDLRALFEILDAAGADISRWEGLADCTAYAVEHRYSSWGGDEGDLDREQLLARVTGLLEHVGRATGLGAP